MIETILQNVDGIILTLVQGAFGNFTPIIEIIWTSMFIIFIAVFGYKAIYSGRFSAPDLIVNTLKIIVLLIVATQWGTFTLLVFDLVTDLPSDIAGILMQSAGSAYSTSNVTDQITANSALTDFYDRAMEVSEELLEGAGWSNFGMYFYIPLIWIGAIGFTGYAAMLIVLSKLAVAILLAVGPFFILMLIFKNSQSLFEGWLRTLLNYAVIPVFVYALLALLLTIAEEPLKYLESNTSPNDALLTPIGSFMFVCMVSVFLLMQIMNIAASITGGLSLSSMGAGAWAARTTMNLGRKAPNAIAKGSIITHAAVRHPEQSTKTARTKIGQAITKTRGF